MDNEQAKWIPASVELGSEARPAIPEQGFAWRTDLKSFSGDPGPWLTPVPGSTDTLRFVRRRVTRFNVASSARTYRRIANSFLGLPDGPRLKDAILTFAEENGWLGNPTLCQEVATGDHLEAESMGMWLETMYFARSVLTAIERYLQFREVRGQYARTQLLDLMAPEFNATDLDESLGSDVIEAAVRSGPWHFPFWPRKELQPAQRNEPEQLLKWTAEALGEALSHRLSSDIGVSVRCGPRGELRAHARTVRAAIYLDLAARSLGLRNRQATCQECGIQFTPNRSDKLFCSGPCLWRSSKRRQRAAAR